ncbi:MAG TPA: hypothetical protein VE650_01990 [Acetobacteraceae bacterium]|nr:hypothetical protein [Acetobacteraceae bacterium]
MTERFLQRWSRLKRGSAGPGAMPPGPHMPDTIGQADLRRAWFTDPVIRDFVEVADNQWDFNDPAALPGFGPLPSATVAERMPARLISTPAQPPLAPAPATTVARLDPTVTEHLDAVWLSSGSRAPAPPSVPAPRPERRPRSTSHGGAMPKDA